MVKSKIACDLNHGLQQINNSIMLSDLINEDFIASLETAEPMEVFNMEPAVNSQQSESLEMSCFGTFGTFGSAGACCGTFGTFGCAG